MYGMVMSLKKKSNRVIKVFNFPLMENKVDDLTPLPLLQLLLLSCDSRGPILRVEEKAFYGNESVFIPFDFNLLDYLSIPDQVPVTAIRSPVEPQGRKESFSWISVTGIRRKPYISNWA